MTRRRQLLLPILFLTAAHAQPLRSRTRVPSFAVASIRLAQSDCAERGIEAPPQGSLAAHCATLKTIILYAYGLGNDDELSGGPDWIRTDKYEFHTALDDAQIAALKDLPTADRDQRLRLMLQSMLAERFHLNLSTATRKLPVYVLTIAKSGLKCTQQPMDSPFAALPKPRFPMSMGPPPPPPPPGWHPPTTPEEIRAHAIAPIHLRTKGWPYWMLVTFLSHQPELGGRLVIDKTGLSGSYDCEASWTRETGDGPYFFTAIQEQMGLRLEAEKEPVQILAVDHVERPTDN
ncbi:MAG TPA: TIGR03435 family protein [Acidobacteriaceae bacterium]|nr:TIGR03435 family protein [Acidobacteriaceae bacterium]